VCQSETQCKYCVWDKDGGLQIHRVKPLKERDSISSAATALCCHSLVLNVCEPQGSGYISHTHTHTHTHTLAQPLTPEQRWQADLQSFIILRSRPLSVSLSLSVKLLTLNIQLYMCYFSPPTHTHTHTLAQSTN